MVSLYPFTFSKAFVKHIVVGNTSVGCCVAETAVSSGVEVAGTQGTRRTYFFKDKWQALSSDLRSS